MKKGLFLSGAIGLMALGLASCSSDEPAGFVDEKVTADETRYLSVSLCSPTNYMSRADFENGTAQESAINQMLFVFYDGSGAPTATMYSVSGNAAANGWTTNPDGNNVNKFWTSVVPVEMTQGQNKPVYVMCFINPIETTGLNTMTLDEIDGLERNAIRRNNLFAMSNSVYYGQNPITGQSNVRVMATPIVDGQLYASEADAQAALANEATSLNIYVERYAAKIGLSMEPAAIKPYEVKIAGATPDAALTDGSITFTPAYWRPNAVDLTTYVTKGFNTSVNGADPTTPATYAEMNTAFANTGMAGEGINGWNDAANHRSYWACSPSYYANEYPTVSDDITDVCPAGQGDTYPYDVQYFSYNQLVNGYEGAPIAWNTDNGFVTTTTGAGYFYSRETTASIEKLTGTGINNKAVPAAANIIGNYKLTGSTATGNPTFYLYGKSEGKDVYYTDANIEAALIANQHVIFTDDQGVNYATSTNSFVVEHPSLEVRGDQKVAGRLVTLQIDPANMAGLYFYDGQDFVPITNDNIVDANKLLWASASTAQKFYNGLAFFAVPIRHLGWQDGIGLTVEGSGNNGRGLSINWPNLRRGDLGVVRNHVYNIEVTEVTGLGIGLGDPGQPMVPPMDPDNYYVAARLNVLAWRVVPTASVTL